MKRAVAFTVFFLLAVILFSPGQEYKGKGRMVGFVYDREGNPLEGVKIKFFSLKVKQGFDIVSDQEGKWVASWIIGGTWNVDFEKIAFVPKKITLEVQEYQRNPEVKINLEKAEGLIITEELKAELNAGNQLFDEGKYEEAGAAYKIMLEKYPDAYILSKNVGNCYFQQEKYDLAEEHYKKILEKEPDNAEAMLLIGNCYANRGQSEKALEWYAKIEFDKINDPIVLYNVGTSFYNSSKFEEALKYYEKAVQTKNDFADGIYQLGLTYLTLGKYQDAIAAFENYLKLDPDSGRASQVKGFIEFLKKKNPD